MLVRASNIESSRQRVETILARWEQAAGAALPRPVILEGDISQAELGLDPRQLDWVRRHCDSVVHNAASLSFQADEKTGEPWRSNVDGTRNVLELCRTTGIRKFHYVSTAYVCGLRDGRILESELDEGQEFANIYEQSKVAAEKMVRESDFLDGPTFYRPAIIVGDSQTGYTSTFHGFYTPLKVVCGLIGMIDPRGDLRRAADGRLGAFRPRGEELRARRLGFGGDGSHLRPSRASRQNLPSHAAAPCRALAVVRGLAKRSSSCTWPNGGATVAAGGQAPLEMLFRNQMDAYRSYWRDDPEFDAANTNRAAGHLPCPELDRNALTRLCRYAIESNFGWPRPRPTPLEFDVQEFFSALPASPPPARPAPGQAVCLGLQVNGTGGGQWQLTVRGGRLLGVEPGLPPNGEPTCYLNSKSFRRLADGNGAASNCCKRAAW